MKGRERVSRESVDDRGKRGGRRDGKPHPPFGSQGFARVRRFGKLTLYRSFYYPEANPEAEAVNFPGDSGQQRAYPCQN